jgi:hypothetical protein
MWLITYAKHFATWWITHVAKSRRGQATTQRNCHVATVPGIVAAWLKYKFFVVHAGVRGFSARSSEVVWVFGRNPLSASLWPDTERDPARIPRIPASSHFLCRWPMCMGDGSHFLSLFLRRHPDLSSSLLLYWRSVYETFTPYFFLKGIRPY